jgi:hypothetical protein
VMLTDNGIVPPVRTPPDVELTACHGELFFEVAAGIEMYTSKIFAGQLMIEYQSHGPELEKSIEAIRSLVCSIAARQAASSVS